MNWSEFIVRVHSLRGLKNCQKSFFLTVTLLKSSEYNLQIICATPYNSLTIYKVSASLDQNCRRNYPETNMLKNKNLSKGL